MILGLLDEAVAAAHGCEAACETSGSTARTVQRWREDPEATTAARARRPRRSTR